MEEEDGGRLIWITHSNRRSGRQWVVRTRVGGECNEERSGVREITLDWKAGAQHRPLGVSHKENNIRFKRKTSESYR